MFHEFQSNAQQINNYWMRLTMIPRIIQTEVNVICRSRRLRRITLTEVGIILDIMRKPNPIIVLLYIQNSDRCKKRFVVKTRVINFPNCCEPFLLFCNFRGLEVVTSSASNNFFFWTAPSNNSRYSAEMIPRLPDIEN